MDDINGLQGIEAPNLGQYATVFLEEMSTYGDNNIPTLKEFEQKLRIIK
jgi:hypothetical protein